MNKGYLQRVLIELLQSEKLHNEVYSNEIRNALLAFGSETPDNLNCAQPIIFGEVKDSPDTLILRKDHAIEFGEIIHKIWGITCHKRLRQRTISAA